MSVLLLPLSSLYSLSGEARLEWKVRDNLAISATYQRYEMHGRDGVTSAEAYPKANVITAGIQLWF